MANDIIDIVVTDNSDNVQLNITPNLVSINVSNTSGNIIGSNYFLASSFAALPVTGDTTTLYVTNDTSFMYRWNGSSYIQIYSNPSLIWGGITGTLSNQTDLQTALNAKAPLASPTFTGTVSGITKSMVGLSNVDNTSDVNKPISSATQTALNLKYDASNPSGYISGITSGQVTTALGYTPENSANKGIANGYASLDGGGLVPSTQLPSYVDDVLEFANLAGFPASGTTGKIYVALDTNKIYRWSGSAYIEVSPTVGTIWGGITGTLSNQTDLQNALNLKYNTPTGDTTQYVAGDGSLITFPVLASADKLILVVRNTSGATITKGTVVYINGASGNKPTIAKALATGDATSAQTLGLVQANIANNSNGNVVLVGSVIDLDTSAFTEGQQLYLSGVTAGTYTATKTLAPTHLVYVGVIARSHPTQGVIEVKIQNGYELDEIHDVSIISEANNDGLFYESSTNLWKNKSIATVLGYTPANATSISGTTNTLAKFTSSSAIGNSNITDTGSLITLGSNTQISSGALGIANSSLTGYTIRLSKNITGSTSSFVVRNEGVVQSDVTSDAIGFRNESHTATAAFTLTNYWHFWARQGSIGAGSAITNQYGYIVDSNMIGATNNYAFQGNIPSGTNRWNLYMGGTAANYLAGVLNIGTTTLSGFNLDVNGTARVQSFTTINAAPLVNGDAALFVNPTTNNSSASAALYGIYNNATVSTIASTSSFTGIYSRNSVGATLVQANGVQGDVNISAGTTAVAQGFTVNSAVTGTGVASTFIGYNFADVFKGGSGVVTRQFGIRIANLTAGGTANVGILFNNASNTTVSGTWDIYAQSGNTSYLAGKLLLGTTTDAGFKLDVNGTARVSGAFTATGNGSFNGVAIGLGNTTNTSNSNTAIGIETLQSNTTAIGCTAVGQSALRNNNGSNNSAFGRNTMRLNTSGVNNSAFGTEVLYTNNGEGNSAFGYQSIYYNTSGSYNSVFGFQSLNSNTSGSNNSVFGSNVLQLNTTGSNNIAIGFSAGRFTVTGTTANTITNNSIYLGYNTKALGDNQTNQIVIGYDAAGLGSNTTVLGNSSTTQTAIYGSLTLGTTSSAASALLQADSTTKGFLPPRMTTTQKTTIATPATGLVVYDTTLNKLSVYTGAAWETVTSL